METQRLVYSGVGALLLLIGIIVFFVGHQGVQEYQTFTGEASRAFSSGHQEQYEQYTMIRIGGAVLAVIGLAELVLN